MSLCNAALCSKRNETLEWYRGNAKRTQALQTPQRHANKNHVGFPELGSGDGDSSVVRSIIPGPQSKTRHCQIPVKVLASTKGRPGTKSAALTSAFGRREIRQVAAPDDGVAFLERDGGAIPTADRGLCQPLRVVRAPQEFHEAILGRQGGDGDVHVDLVLEAMLDYRLPRVAGVVCLVGTDGACTRHPGNRSAH